MTHFEFRRFLVVEFDKHGVSNPSKRRRGDSVDRALIVTEQGRDPVYLNDADGDDYETYRWRAEGSFCDYLNHAGREGWRVVYCEIQPWHEGRPGWPVGTHLLECAVTSDEVD